jgi:hypothetical protein
MFPTLLVTGGKRQTFDFTPLQIPLTAGHEYFVSFETPFGVFSSNGLNAPFYVGVIQFTPVLDRMAAFAADGVHWQLYTNTEVLLTVRAIPEPSYIATALTAIAIIGVRRRR